LEVETSYEAINKSKIDELVKGKPPKFYREVKSQRYRITGSTTPFICETLREVVQAKIPRVSDYKREQHIIHI